MGRLEDLETELDTARERLDEAVNAGRRDEIENLRGEMDRISCELRTFEDNWVPEVTDTDYNELG